MRPPRGNSWSSAARGASGPGNCIVTWACASTTAFCSTRCPASSTRDESRDYSRCERYLGEKASHGCIRIQRKLTPEGVNMQWLWDNLKVGCKVIIWDEIGRELTFRRMR